MAFIMDKEKQEKGYQLRGLIRDIATEGSVTIRRYSSAWELLYTEALEGRLNREYSGDANSSCDTFTFAPGYKPVIYLPKEKRGQYNDGL